MSRPRRRRTPPSMVHDEFAHIDTEILREWLQAQIDHTNRVVAWKRAGRPDPAPGPFVTPEHLCVVDEVRARRAAH